MQLLSLIGSKTQLSKQIAKHFPEHSTYVDVFGGTGIVLLNKKPVDIEVYNDANIGLYSFFNSLKKNPNLLFDKIKEIKYHKETYFSFYKIYKSDKFLKLSEVDKAMIVFVCSNMSTMGCFRTFGYTKEATFYNKIDKIKKVSKRFKNAVVECSDFETVIKKYDSKDTLFYCDPPYVGTENIYNHNQIYFEHKDHKRMSNILNEIKGKCVLSYYYDEEMLRCYDGWHIKNLVIQENTSNFNSVRGKKKNKLLLMNFKPKGKDYEIIDASCL